ncbi:hypothetical protein INT45_003044 [Circinella minor]|uniref:Tc1-like transposase DDE domain-containing protein n=1 Tax=Circinella minor TaxID=1195481 RepID=A0A8H7RLC3_9FUNG|nr:hypothetical protein INT45_003044 [Circinella minor]
MRNAMEKLQISTKENETTAPAISISKEDIVIEPEIVIVQEEDIDEEPENYYFEFPVDPARLVQDGDYIDSSTDDDTDDDNESILDLSVGKEWLFLILQEESVMIMFPRSHIRNTTTKLNVEQMMKQKIYKRLLLEYIQSGIAKYGHNCVFIDEASVCASLQRNYAWAPVGEVANVKVPQLCTQSKTIITAICHTGVVELCVKTNEGGTKTRDFYAFLGLVMNKLDKRNLAHQGWNLIYNNAPIHKAAYLGEMVDYHPTEQNEVEIETGVEEEEEEEDNVDDME